MINKKLDYNTELMLITMEECGELIEACSKTIRCEDYVNHPKMIEEVGDVLLLIEMTLVFQHQKLIKNGHFVHQKPEN